MKSTILILFFLLPTTLTHSAEVKQNPNRARGGIVASPRGIVVLDERGKKQVSERQIIHCLLGESRNQGLIGLTATAEALRNRGTIKGIYGCKAVFNEPQWVWDMGKKAWEASKTSNLVKGASFWENEDTFGKPYWAKNMRQTAKIGKHIYYVEK